MPTLDVKRKKRWGVWKILGLILLIILILIGGLAVILWNQKGQIFERAAIGILENRDIEAHLDIEKLTTQDAVIKNIRLEREGRTFFSASELKVSYEWREAMAGHIHSLSLREPIVRLDIDESGQIILPWESSDGAQHSPTAFPKDGVQIEAGQIFLSSPYGVLEMKLDGEVEDPQTGHGQISLMPSLLTSGPIRGTVSAHMDVKFQDAQISGDFELGLREAQSSDWSVKHVQIKGTGDLRDLSSLQSDMKINITDWLSPNIELSSATARWDGQIERHVAELAQRQSENDNFLTLSGRWDIDPTFIKIRDKETRQRWAQQLTGFEFLSSLSMTEPFSLGLTRQIEILLEGSEIEGGGDIDIRPDKKRLVLKKPLSARSASHEAKGSERSGGIDLSVAANDSGPVYQFDAETEEVKLNLNASLSGAYPLEMKDAKIQMGSQSGLDLKSLDAASMTLKLLNVWRGRLEDGRRARLAPLTAKIDYKSGPDQRRLTLKTRVDYDGAIPGGYVQGLQGGGELRADFIGSDMAIIFNPYPGSHIEIEHFENLTDWRVRDVKFNITTPFPLYDRKTPKQGLTARLKDGSGHLYHKTEARNLDFVFDEAAIKGILQDDHQRWDVLVTDGEMTSETIPGPGTQIHSPHVDMEFELLSESPVKFIIESPETIMHTQFFEVETMHVKAKGTPDDMDVNYQGGHVTLSAGEFPPLPLTGDIHYKDGQWMGAAQTVLPKAESTPLDIIYGFENGSGWADIELVELPFSMKGLQPQHLVPALRGKIADVEGGVSANIHVKFSPDQPMQSSGTARLHNVNLGTLPGPINGLNGDLTFSSFFPLTTQGRQSVTLDSFDPGFPMPNGHIDFEIIPDGFQVHKAQWPIGDIGTISLDPTVWKYAAPRNTMVMRVKSVSLEDIIGERGGESFRITGLVSGVLPIVMDGVHIVAEGGVLRVDDGGVIQLKSSQTDAAAQTEEMAGLAFEALENFKYDTLEVHFDGPLDGEIYLGIEFQGSHILQSGEDKVQETSITDAMSNMSKMVNNSVVNNSEFIFRVGVSGELFNLLRNLQEGQNISSRITQKLSTLNQNSPNSEGND